jgi:hypothetical protein
LTTDKNPLYAQPTDLSTGNPPIPIKDMVLPLESIPPLYGTMKATCLVPNSEDTDDSNPECV